MSRRRLAFLLLAFLTASPASAGKLKEFEKAATKRPSEPPRPQANGSQDGDPFLADFYSGVIRGFILGGEYSVARVRPAWNREFAADARENGEALIPFARGELGYQWVRGGVDALDLRAEAGYACVGLEVRRTRYWDRRSDEALATTSIHALYRMSIDRFMEIDLGGGPYFLEGEENHQGSSFTVPILIAPSQFVGLEFRPSWHALEGYTIRDHTILVRAGRRGAYATAGYRWVQSGSVALDGPQLGLTVVW